MGTLTLGFAARRQGGWEQENGKASRKREGGKTGEGQGRERAVRRACIRWCSSGAFTLWSNVSTLVLRARQWGLPLPPTLPRPAKPPSPTPLFPAPTVDPTLRPEVLPEVLAASSAEGP